MSITRLGSGRTRLLMLFAVLIAERSGSAEDFRSPAPLAMSTPWLGHEVDPGYRATTRKILIAGPTKVLLRNEFNYEMSLLRAREWASRSNLVSKWIATDRQRCVRVIYVRSAVVA